MFNTALRKQQDHLQQVHNLLEKKYKILEQKHYGLCKQVDQHRKDYNRLQEDHNSLRREFDYLEKRYNVFLAEDHKDLRKPKHTQHLSLIHI